MPGAANYSRDMAFPPAKLHVITGKGGTGKTTVAAALAIALASGGRRVLLIEVEDRQGIAQLFGLAPLPYEEKRVATAPGGGEVYGLAVDPEEALLEYLDMFYNLRRAGRALKRIGAIDFATTIAPGMRDVLLTGKVMEASTRERRGGGRLYDAVVLDAPPTGRIARFLNVNSEVAGLARMGPIRKQAESVMRTLKSDRTAIHLVTLLEEMPVQETVDGVAELQSVGLPVGAIVVNLVREPLLPPDDLALALRHRLDVQEVTRGLKSAGIEATAGLLTALGGEAYDHAARVALESRERERLLALDRPLLELPQLPDAGELSGLNDLARRLCDQGVQ